VDERTGPSRRFELARRFLFWAFVAQVPLGYSVAFAYESELWAWHREGMADALWGTTGVPAVAVPVVHQLAAMLGATIACWGVAMAWVVAGPFRRRERWAWFCVASSFAAWFVVDTWLSLTHGVTVNVFFNLGALALIGGPLALTWDAFRDSA